MRKNLFLTLALIVASVATVNAQWSKVLNAVDGLPGVNDPSINCKVVSTDLITPDAAIGGLRFTVIETQNMEIPTGHTYPTTSLAELVVLNANGDTINYTATCNALQPGQNIAHLNDGDYATFAHTSWVANEPVDTYHYYELTFEAPVSSFSLFWANRQGNPKNAPATVVLTEKGVSGADVELPEVPGSTFSLGSQLMTIDEIVASGYVTLLTEGLFVGDYNKEYTGLLGDKFYTSKNTIVYEDSTHLYNGGMAMQVLPSTTEEGKYNLYWPELGYYIHKTELGTVTNETFWQAWQNQTTNRSSAANFTLAPAIDKDGNEIAGQFTLSYETTTSNGDEMVAYIAGTPINVGIKMFNENFKAALESGDYSKGYGVPVSFNFKFMACQYEKADYMIKNDLKAQLMISENVANSFDGAQEAESYIENEGFTTYADFMANIATAKDYIEKGATVLEAATIIDALKANEIWYLYSVVYQDYLDAYTVYAELEAEGLFCDPENPVAGSYTADSWNNGIGSTLTALFTEGVMAKVDNNGPLYSYFNEFSAAIESIATGLETFYATKITSTPFPLVFETTTGGTYVQALEARTWTTPSIRPTIGEDVEGFRITVLGNYNPGGSATVKNNLYPGVCIGELIIMDANGNKLNVTADMVTTNALELNEGSIAGLFDGVFDAEGNLTSINFKTPEESSTGKKDGFYHSPWSGNYTWDPLGFVYLDVKLPAGVDGFQIAFYSNKSNNNLMPSKVYIGEYGVEYDPIVTQPNTYNATVGEQITSADQIEDWGVYAIQGLILTNPNAEAVPNPSVPYWYAGRENFHKEIVREQCAYFFTKNSDGTFRIMSIGESKFWKYNANTVELTSYSSEAANFNIVPSQNPDFAGQNTLIIYSDIAEPDSISGSFEYVDEEAGDEVIIDSVAFLPTKRVVMDWGPGYGVHSRPVINIQPGVINAEDYSGPGADDVEILLDYPALIANSGAGDYLHFNKTSGEGEWKIYRLSLDNPFYYWCTALAPIAEGLGFVEGNNPGQFKDLGSFATDLAAVQAVIENNDYAASEAAAKKLATTLESLSNGELAKNPITAGVYAFINSARSGEKAMTINDAGKVVGVTAPTSYDFAEDNAFLFELAAPKNIDILVMNGTVSEENRDNVYTIKHLHTGNYLVGGEGQSQPLTLSAIVDQAGAFLFTNGPTEYFTIGKICDLTNHFQLHLDGGLNVVGWNGDAVSTSGSAWKLQYVAADATSIDDIVVEGAEAVSTEIYTAAGVKVAAPVKGVNIVTTVNEDGSVKVQKIVVE